LKVLVYTIASGSLKLSQESKERIRRRIRGAKVDVVFEDNHENAVREIEDADILFGYITQRMLRKAKRLRWIQAPISSLGIPSGEYCIFPELAESDVILTNTSGIYSDIIPTHVFAFITCFARDFPKLIRSQTRGVWDTGIKTINLRGRTLGIVGLGSIGKRVARIGAAFGMRIVAVEPKPQDIPPFVKKVWGAKHLKSLMRESDFVVLCLPDAPGTVNLVGAEGLQAMKTTAYLINIGRGRTVDLDALTQALKNGELAGAGLDVFPPGYEPLPPDHPLWSMDNVIITPHCAGFVTPFERKIDVFLENFDRYMRGEGLLNLVDKKSMILAGPVYTIPE
jgi:phosphoglycerate dehydrogenase-like enzyme